MGSLERSKKKVQLWKKATVHFLLCFVMGFFTGFAPTGKSSLSLYRPESATNRVNSSPKMQNNSSFNISSVWVQTPASAPVEYRDKKHVKMSQKVVTPKRLVIVVTPTSMRVKTYRGVLLRRLGNTLRLVSQPVLWIVVEQQSEKDPSGVSKVLRKTGIMYRHVVCKENFTDFEAEVDHQRNVALNHIEQHRLSGIVHFAGLDNVYDLAFFREIRTIEAFGAWPIAKLGVNRKKVIIEGPVCDSSEVMGWHMKKKENNSETTPPPIHISSFAFNSSILWDPERWGRTSSIQDNTQNSLKFVKKEVLEEETKLKGLPTDDCSRILLWNLNIFKQR